MSKTNRKRRKVMAKMNLNLSGVGTLGGKKVVPTGIYNVKIASAEIKEVGNGHMLKVGFEVLDGSEKGSQPQEDMWVAHSNEKAKSFGLSKLKTILIAGGHANPDMLADSDELLGLKLRISVEEGIQMKDGQPVCDDDGKPYRQNEFKGFFKYDGNAESVSEAPAKTEAVKPQITQSSQAPAPVEAPAPAPAPAPESGEKFPWES